MKPTIKVIEHDEERIVFVAINSIRRKEWEYIGSNSRAQAFTEARAYCAGAKDMAKVIEMTTAAGA
ncbi:MAG: hypothetical protein ROR55_19735 [Devosia sp.]